MAIAPKWAQDLVLDALLYWQTAHGEDKPVPEITWRCAHAGKERTTLWGSRMRPSKKQFSTGVTQLDGKGITITAGADRVDQRLVLLHELGHVIAGAREGHSTHFWDVAWELYRWAKIPVRYAKEREGNYRKGALAAYRRNLKGA